MRMGLFKIPRLETPRFQMTVKVAIASGQYVLLLIHSTEEIKMLSFFTLLVYTTKIVTWPKHVKNSKIWISSFNWVWTNNLNRYQKTHLSISLYTVYLLYTTVQPRIHFSVCLLL